MTNILLFAAGAILVGSVLVFASRVLELLRRIARAVEVQPVVTTLESTELDVDLRKQIEEIEKERGELLAKVIKKATEIADESASRWKKEIERLDRTIEMGSVRPRRGSSPTQGPKNPTPPPGDSATEPSEKVFVSPRPPLNISPLALVYHCACGWEGELASSDEAGEKTLCPTCRKEIQA